MYSELFFFITGIFITAYALLGALPKRLKLSQTNPAVVRASVAGLGVILIGVGIFSDSSIMTHHTAIEPTATAVAQVTSGEQTRSMPETTAQSVTKPASPQPPASTPSGTPSSSTPQLSPQVEANVQAQSVPNIKVTPVKVKVGTLPDSVAQRVIERARAQQKAEKGL